MKATTYKEIVEEIGKSITADHIYINRYLRWNEQLLFEFANPYGRFYTDTGPSVWLTLEGIAKSNNKAKESQK
jgi:hypothetical protein